MYQCSVCSFQSMYKYNVDRHEKVKHSKPNFNAHTINNDITHQTGSGAVQSVQPHSGKEKHANLQEESVEQLYENIDQWQKAYDTLKEQYQQVEKVTTCNDGRPSHVSIQLARAAALQSVAVRRSTGNDVVATIFTIIFSVFSFQFLRCDLFS